MMSDEEKNGNDEDAPISLPPEEWDPPPKAKRGAGEDGQKMAAMADQTKYVDKKYNLSYEEIIKTLDEKIQVLLTKQDFTTLSTRPDLKFIQRQTRYNVDIVLQRRIVDKIVRFGIGHVFLRVWQSVNPVNYLGTDYHAAFKNLQTILSIVWNCSDKSASLCDSMVRCGVIQLFLTELASSKLKDCDLNNENCVYLLKAYLGILHNIVRMCSDSRKVFRGANAVNLLQQYVQGLKQGLVKTKAFLILSYIITEEENAIINATDENIQYILGILKEAMESENHFSPTYAFWATEIACGVNHLAVNDKNKVRLGRLGALSLYIKLLQSEKVEEQNLGSAGLWILAFKEENKRILRQEPGCMEALQSISTSSPHESIRRAARGALWVVKSAPERPLPRTVAVETDVPHVMISYHWTGQEIMIKVKDKLKSAGYKVWMDVDNMSGSTLEAMALAVERASVVLVCMSQGYKDSPSCRTEAEYMYRLRKCVIPLVLQAGYVPDGWLGIMVGTLLHFDFSAKENIATQLPRLMKEIGTRGRLTHMMHNTTLTGQSTPSRDHDSAESVGSSSALQSSVSISSLHSYHGRASQAAGWDCEDVQSWLETVDLAPVAARFDKFDGPLLLQYKKMMESAPTYFYHTLEDGLQLDLVSILQLTRALENLKP